jgi:hypothetical protein
MTTQFHRGAVKPLTCLQSGFALIKDQYWLFLGVSLVGLLIGGALPLGVLLGPAMCGLYLCFFARMRGERIKFDLLFKGFDYFGKSLLAGIAQTAPMFILIIVAYLPAIALPLLLHSGGQAHADRAVLGGVFVAMFVFAIVAGLVGSLIAMLFGFSYPLIVERQMTAGEALKMSVRAVIANAGGMLGLFFLNFLIGIVLLPLCCVGVYLVSPIFLASYAVAYRSIFPEIKSAAPPLLNAG